jgi:small subunit ribosomal protein S11
LTLTVSATRNNTVLTFADHTGPIFPTISAGTDKTFKNSQRASYEAAHQAALKMFSKVEDYVRTSGVGNRRMKVVFNGLRGGQGREAVASAISGQEGDGIRQAIGRVEDRTGIKIGGTRGKRVRRL